MPTSGDGKRGVPNPSKSVPNSGGLGTDYAKFRAICTQPPSFVPNRTQPSKRYLNHKKQQRIQRPTSTISKLGKVGFINKKGLPRGETDFPLELGTLVRGRTHTPVISLDLRECASRSVEQRFVDAWALPGVYGLVDPLTDHVAYVGRSVHIGRRYRQHLNQIDARRGSPAHRRNEWVRAVLRSGQMPGLVLLDIRNEAWVESYLIKQGRARGWCELNGAD